MIFRKLVGTIATPIAFGFMAASATAQAPASTASVQGMVIDSETESPIPTATVTLEPSSSAPINRERREMRVDPAGRYHFSGLRAEHYRITLRALGYRPAEVSVSIDPSTHQRLSVGLTVLPVRLQRVEVLSHSSSAFARAASRNNSRVARADAAKRRRELFLSSDAALVTENDVRDAVTVGEPDIFRTIRRLPGVSVRDDYTSALWIRGAPSDQTQIALDGMPLFNPVHGAGLLSAVNTDALDAVAFHPGVQRLASANTAAGVIDLKSRKGTATDSRVFTELSLLSARATVDRSAMDGRLRYMVGARRSHLDLVKPAINLIGRHQSRLPYAFEDAIGRVDLQLTQSTDLLVSAFATGDRLTGNIPGIVQESRAKWRTRAAQVTLSSRFGSSVLRHSIGVSGSAAQATVTDAAALTTLPGFERHECGCFMPLVEGYVAQPLQNGIRFSFVSSVLQRQRSDDTKGLEAGFRLIGLGSWFMTEGAWPHSLKPGGVVKSASDMRAAIGWVENTIQKKGLTINGGMRIETGTAVRSLPRIRVGPRATAAFRLNERVKFSAGAGRTFQYWQALAPRGSGTNAIATSDIFWVVGDQRSPGIESDIATLGAETFQGMFSASATIYLRRSSGLALPSQDSGALAGSSLFVEGSNDARGFEILARKNEGVLTGMVSYARGTSNVTVGNRTSPAPWERQHMFRAGATVSTIRGLRLSSQFLWETGAPFTRYFAGNPYCGIDGCAWSLPPSAGASGGQRHGAYRSLDVGADWQGGPKDRYGFFLQVTNVLGTRNPGTYLGTSGSCAPQLPCDPLRGIWASTKDENLPALPATFAAGVRLVF